MANGTTIVEEHLLAKPGEERGTLTGWIQDRANTLLRAGNGEVRRLPLDRALQAETTHADDCILPYVLLV